MGEVTREVTVKTDGEVRKAYCNQCGGETNQNVLYSKSVYWKEDVDEEFVGAIDGRDTHSLIECRGCDGIRLLHEHWFSEDWDHGGPTQYQEYYPANEVRPRPDWLNEVPEELHELKELVGEVYQALAGNALRLAAMGIRSLVEKIMIDRVGDQGNFIENIAAFFEAGFVAPQQQEMFKGTLVEAGHAAMHRDWEPSSREVMTLLDIVEGLIKSIYVDSSRAAKVSIPPRATRKGGRGKPASEQSEVGPCT